MPADDGRAWVERMRCGDFSAAWTICDRVLGAATHRERVDLPRHRQAIWDGSPVDGRDVLVRCYHGLGDTIQFARYLPRLRARARRVTVCVQPALLPLLESMHAVDRCVPLSDAEPAVDYEIDIELMELPYMFRTTLDTIPRTVPYLHVDPLPLPHGTNLAAGLVWGAGDWDDRRSIPLSTFAPVLELPVSWFILQGGGALGERPHDLGLVVGATDIVEAARAMRSLDLMITVDSMPAHLAGALGVPVWTLLPYDADWRWMSERHDSPWYPTMRLFRQPAPGDWRSVITRVTEALQAELAREDVFRRPLQMPAVESQAVERAYTPR